MAENWEYNQRDRDRAYAIASSLLIATVGAVLLVPAVALLFLVVRYS